MQSQFNNVILHLGQPTAGDADFFKRWEEVGFTTNEVNYDLITTIVVDQYRPVDGAFLAIFPNLKYVCSPTTGHTHLRFDPLKHKVKIITLRNETSFLQTITSTAEFTLYLLMRLAREYAEAPVKLWGKHFGIIGGLGRIGEQVLRMVRGLGMIPMIYDQGFPHRYLQELLETCDFISIHVDENPSSRGLVSSEWIGKMKPSAFLINTSRASIIDEDALLDALRENKIQGAALDVVNDPLAFMGLRNALVTDHIAGRCLEDRIATDQFIIEKLKKELIKDCCQSPDTTPV